MQHIRIQCFTNQFITMFLVYNILLFLIHYINHVLYKNKLYRSILQLMWSLVISPFIVSTSVWVCERERLNVANFMSGQLIIRGGRKYNWKSCNTIRSAQIKLHRLIEPVNQEKWNCFPSLDIIIFREINSFTVWLKQPWFRESSTVNEHMSVVEHPHFTTLNTQRGENHRFYSSSFSEEFRLIYILPYV